MTPWHVVDRNGMPVLALQYWNLQRTFRRMLRQRVRLASISACQVPIEIGCRMSPFVVQRPSRHFMPAPPQPTAAPSPEFRPPSLAGWASGDRWRAGRPCSVGPDRFWSVPPSSGHQFVEPLVLRRLPIRSRRLFRRSLPNIVQAYLITRMLATERGLMTCKLAEAIHGWITVDVTNAARMLGRIPVLADSAPVYRARRLKAPFYCQPMYSNFLIPVEQALKFGS